MGVSANFTIVTLGVADLDRSIAFYEALGWERRGDRAQDIVWFRTSGTWLGLFGDDALAEDVGVAPVDVAAPRSYRGITLALNLSTEAEVDAAFAVAGAAGAEVVKPAERTTWGGYSGYVADPDGHLWELCCNPFFLPDADGRIDIA